LVGDEWKLHVPNIFNPEKKPDARWIGELVDPSEGLNIVKTGNISLSAGKSYVLSVASRRLLIKIITYKHFRSSNNTK